MCRQQNISMLLWTFGLKEDFVKGEALPLPIFAPPWIHPLEYLAETTTSWMAAFQFQVKPFVFEALFDYLPCLGSTPGWIWSRVDLIKSLNTYCKRANIRDGFNFAMFEVDDFSAKLKPLWSFYNTSVYSYLWLHVHLKIPNPWN